jgi:CysZ protein
MIPIFRTTNTFADFFDGLFLPFRAFGIILRSPRVLLLSLLSALVTAFTLVALGLAAWPLTQDLSEKLISREGSAWHVAQVAMGVVLFAVFYLVGALTIPNLLLAPLQDPISEAVETKLGQFVAPVFSISQMLRGVKESLKHTLFRLFFMALGFALLFPFNFIPGIGNIIWLIGGTMWSAFWLGVEYLSNPMARHLRSVREVVNVMRNRLFLGLGFGLSLFVMLWIPIVNFFLMPMAVVMGTLMYRGLLACKSIEERA